MIVIYDFDGTLTPYSTPQYEIIKNVGYNNESFFKRIASEKQKHDNINKYELYFKCFHDILEENNIAKTEENLCYGAERVNFNYGVIDYFDKYQSAKTGIKHYIVTSGIKDYVLNTPIKEYIDGVYGVTYKKTQNGYGEIDTLLTDERKVDAIKDIRAKNNNTTDIIYFGDGPTDRMAFEYVHSIGGKSVFILSNEDSLLKYNKVNGTECIDNLFLADFSDGSKIDNFISGRMNYLKKIEKDDEER